MNLGNVAGKVVVSARAGSAPFGVGLFQNDGGASGLRRAYGGHETAYAASCDDDVGIENFLNRQHEHLLVLNFSGRGNPRAVSCGLWGDAG